MSWADNIFYSPEAHGLEVVGEVEFSTGSYEFDTTVVWRDPATGELFFADDAGCSCPSPFEDHKRSTLTPITRPQDLIDHLEERRRYASDGYGADPVTLVDEIGRLVLKVREAWQAAR